jgi:hypothetical protein
MFYAIYYYLLLIYVIPNFYYKKRGKILDNWEIDKVEKLFKNNPKYDKDFVMKYNE